MLAWGPGLMGAASGDRQGVNQETNQGGRGLGAAKPFPAVQPVLHKPPPISDGQPPIMSALDALHMK